MPGETAENAIHEASLDRFRPILMTTLAAVIGAVPIAAGTEPMELHADRWAW